MNVSPLAKRRRTISAFERHVVWEDDSDGELAEESERRKRRDSKTVEEEDHELTFTNTTPASAPAHSVSVKDKKDKEKAKGSFSRRQSHDTVLGPRQFLIDVESTRELILRQEDTDGDKKITIMDNGPKVVTLGTLRSEGFIRADVRGTYVISTLLQELALAQDQGLKRIVLSETVLNENPVDRLTRMIKTLFWKNLTRRVDLTGLTAISADPKAFCKMPRIYVPSSDPVALHYFQEISEKTLGRTFEVTLM